TFNVPKSTVLTLTASDGAGYNFLYWKLNSTTAGTPGASYSHTVAGDATITAVFANNASGTAAYEVTVAKDPAATDGAVTWSYTHSGTTVTGGMGTFNMPKSAVLILTATEGANYDLLYWKLNSATAGTSGTSFSHTVAGTVRISAVFVDNTSGTAAYAVTVAKDPASVNGTVTWSYTDLGVTVTGGVGTFNIPRSAVLTLTAAGGASGDFLYWKLNNANVGTPGTSHTHTVAGTAKITAVFANNVSGTAAYAVTVAKDPVAADGAVTWSYTDSGVTVTGGAGTFNMPKSTLLTLTAADGANHDFLYWKLNNATTGTSGMSYVHTVAGTVKISAVFVNNTTGTAAYEVTVANDLAAAYRAMAAENSKTGGTLFWSYTHSGMTVTGGAGTFNMPRSAVLTLTAADGANNDFLYWKLNSATAGMPEISYTYTITGTTKISAVFADNTSGTAAYEITVAKDPAKIDGTISWSYTNSGMTVTGGTGTFSMPAGVTLDLIATDGTTAFLQWEISSPYSTDGSKTISHTVAGAAKITAKFTAPSQAYNNPKEYLLTATSDGVTAITPNGTVTVLGGGNRTFNFSASDGYYVSKVQIDGIDLSQEEISLGYYTFHDVNSSHIISVSGSTSPLINNNAILRVVVVEGNGYAMYSINNSSYQIYSGPVSLPENAYVTVRAIADKKYEFSGWGNNGEIYWNDLDYSMQDLAESMYLELHFASLDGSSDLLWWTLAAIVALVIAGTIIGLIFFFGKSYDVIKASYSADIIGRDRARNKKDYRFSVEEGFLGTVLYRVGKDGKWKILLPTKNGDYVIPKDEVVDEFIIETR
ncbi:MAG: hypothetical protein LBG63_01840, partial [Candidatus Methanoplasma sp.]|nr:hypothetical protein [Candidatus Methanoplasma sp.]